MSRWLDEVSAWRRAGYASPVTALWDNDAITLAEMLRRREVSAREVIAAHIERIETVDATVNAVITRCFEQAMAMAGAADQALARGEPPRLLHGRRSRTRTSSTPQESAPRTDHRCLRNTCPTVTGCW